MLSILIIKSPGAHTTNIPKQDTLYTYTTNPNTRTRIPTKTTQHLHLQSTITAQSPRMAICIQNPL